MVTVGPSNGRFLLTGGIFVTDLLIALFFDVLIGDPYFLPHPVRLMGKIIEYEEKTVRKIARNDRELKVLGGLIVLVNVSIAYTIPFFLLTFVKKSTLFYHAVNTYFLFTCVSAGCLHREAMKVYDYLSKGLEEARYKLSFIVGRDTANLSQKEIIRAAVETVAENTCDGVIAPLVYALIGGAPLAFTYKMVNTMDSMLGYMNERYRHIGFFPAKTDDLFNFFPSRLTGILMCLGSAFRFDALRGFKIMVRDRHNHKSPNCAYPEGATAGLLGIQLGGDNFYFGQLVSKPTIGDKVRPLERDDIKRAIEIMYRAEIFLIITYLLLR